MEHSLGRQCLAILAIILFAMVHARADVVPVRHLAGVTFGFLELRTLEGTPIAYGNLQQIVKAGRVTDDLTFHFKDGSFFEEITNFTQREQFRLVSDQVIQKGPSFKEQLESWLDVQTGSLTVRHWNRGKEKVIEKHLDLPPDVSNGLIFTLVKNVDPSAPNTTITMVATSSGRLIKVNVIPEKEAIVRFGSLTQKAQHYRLHFDIGGITGDLASLVGKQPPDMHVWMVKSEAPVFVESEGPLYDGGPVWRIQQAAPDFGMHHSRIQ